MKSYVGAVVLLAIVANLMTLHTVCGANLPQVVENCFRKNRASCADINNYLAALRRNVVGKGSPALCFFACLDTDSGNMAYGKSFNIANFNAWYPRSAWAAIDPLVTKCTSGNNMWIKNVCDREYDFIRCLHAQGPQKTMSPSTPIVPAACRR